MNEKKIDYEMEALKLKSLLTILAGIDPDNTQALYEIPTVAKIALDSAEIVYCAILEKEL